MLFLFIVSLLSSVLAQPTTLKPSMNPTSTPSSSIAPSSPSSIAPSSIAPSSPSSIAPSSIAPSSIAPSLVPSSSSPSIPSTRSPSVTDSPTSYVPPGADTDLYFTIEARQSDFVKEMLLDEIHTFFHWPLDYTPGYVGLQVDPYNSSQLVVHYKVGGNRAEEAFQIWSESGTNLTSRSTAGIYPMVDLALRPPARGCAPDAIIDCQPTSFQNADLRDCECDTSLTGLGVFTYVILPIALLVGLIVAICFFLPGCPLYQRAPVDRRQYKAPPQNGEGEGTRIAMDTHDSEA